jgi:catechol 2,3-dioxygenase-like lactoylglutathione lyase family enzyme
MIKGVHAMFYSSQADALRGFLRDTLGLSFTDVGGGWLIFDLPEAEMGVHPADDTQPHARAGTHDISFYCDDIGQTVAALKGKGVEFAGEPQDQGYGIVTQFKLPGDVMVHLYQPHYKKTPKASPAPPAARAAARKKSRPKPAKAMSKKPAKKKAGNKAVKKGKRRAKKR